MKTLGVITIGQTPRPDLLEPLREISARCTIEVRGALDGLDDDAIRTAIAARPDDANDEYLLVTSLRSGERIMIEESTLTPLVQDRIDELDASGVTQLLLLCAGPFRGLKSVAPLIRPFDVAVGEIRARGLRSAGIVVPINAQIEPARRKWTNAGIAATVWSLEQSPPNTTIDEWLESKYHDSVPARIRAIVFDYVGYRKAVRVLVRERTGVPVLDLGDLAIELTRQRIEA